MCTKKLDKTFVVRKHTSRRYKVQPDAGHISSSDIVSNTFLIRFRYTYLASYLTSAEILSGGTHAV